MILYKKSFPLGKSISFSSYIKALERKRFPNYYIRLEKIPSTANYHATVVFTGQNWQRSLRGQFIDEVFLKDWVFQYSEGEKHFSIQASPRTENLLAALSMVMLAIVLFFSVFIMSINDNMSIKAIFILGMIFMLLPPILIYLQDKIFLDEVGSLGTEP